LTVEEVYVNSFDNSEVAWVEVGASPYLNDSNANYIFTDGSNYYESKFGFPNSAGSGTINSVKIRVEAYQVPVDVGRVASIYVWDGSAWRFLGNVGEALSYTWFELDASAVLNTWDKINGALLRIRASTGDGEIYVRRATRKVDYTSVAVVVPKPLGEGLTFVG
jgi:hypothetical protein